jgi:hypothetical protein
MRAEVKKALKEELKAVRNTRISILIGLTMVILDVILVTTSIFSLYSLIFVLPLILIIRHQIQEHRIKSMVLIFARYLVDEEYAKTFNTEDDEK